MTDHRRRRGLAASIAAAFAAAAALLVPAAAYASPPSNDDFASAQTVTVLDGSFVTVNATNSEATTEAGEPLAFASEGTTVWYQWTAPYDANVELDTIGSDFDTQLGVYTGSSLNTLSLVAGDDDSGGSFTSKLNFAAQQGTTYSFQVGGFGKAVGDIVLNGTLTPSNDAFANAIALSGAHVTAQGSTWNATTEAGEPILAPGQASVWYTWQAPRTGKVIISSTSPTCNAQAGVVPWTGTDLSSLTDVPTDNDGNFVAQAGQVYDLMFLSVNGGTDPRCDFGFALDQAAGDLSTSQHGKATTTVGTTLVDTVSVSNAGPDTMNSISFDDTIPADALYLGITPPTSGSSWLCNASLTPENVLHCSIDQLGPGHTTKATVRYVALQPTSLDNAVTVSSVDAEANPGNESSDLITAVTTAPKTIYSTVDANGFTPSVISVPRGWTVFWQNTDSDVHTVTDDTGLGLFDLLEQSPPAWGKFTFNGAGVYSIVDTPTDDDQTIKVPMAVAPLTGDSTTHFIVTWAANNPPDGYIYDIDIKRPLSTWVDWQTTSAKSATFIADGGPGTYTFRARLRKLSSAAASGWVTRTITVS